MATIPIIQTNIRPVIIQNESILLSFILGGFVTLATSLCMFLVSMISSVCLTGILSVSASTNKLLYLSRLILILIRFDFLV